MCISSRSFFRGVSAICLVVGSVSAIAATSPEVNEALTQLAVAKAQVASVRASLAQAQPPVGPGGRPVGFGGAQACRSYIGEAQTLQDAETRLVSVEVTLRRLDGNGGIGGGWYCTIESDFNDSFSGEGRTQLEAKNIAKKNCGAKHSPAACDEKTFACERI